MNSNPMEIFKNMLTMGNDPRQIKEMMMQRNPQLRVLENQINQSGLDPIQFVMQLAKQNNVPINENAILNMCQQMRSMTSKK